MHKLPGNPSLRLGHILSSDSQLSFKDRCFSPVGNYTCRYDGVDEDYLLLADPPLPPRGEEHERLLRTPHGEGRHSTLADTPPVVGAGSDRRSGGSGGAAIDAGDPDARSLPPKGQDSPPANGEFRPHQHGYRVHVPQPITVGSTPREAVCLSAQGPSVFEWRQPQPTSRMMLLEAHDVPAGYGNRQPTCVARIQTGGSSGTKRKFIEGASTVGMLREEMLPSGRIPNGRSASYSGASQGMQLAGSAANFEPAYPSEVLLSPRVPMDQGANGDGVGGNGGANCPPDPVLSPAGRSLLLRQQLQQVPPGEPVIHAGPAIHTAPQGSASEGQLGSTLAPTGSLAANLAMLPCAMQNIVHLNPGKGATAALRHLAEGIISAQSALEDKLAHVMAERDAYAAQLADLRRYQGGRTIVMSSTVAPPQPSGSQQQQPPTPHTRPSTAASEAGDAVAPLTQQRPADGPAAADGSPGAHGSALAVAVVPAGVSADMVPREHLQRVQAQLNAATEVGEAFNKTRGDVRRERKLMQRVAALEEEVSQLKGQLLQRILGGPGGEPVLPQSAQDTTAAVAADGDQQQQQQQEAQEDSPKEQNAQLVAALSEDPLQCLGSVTECSVRLAGLQTGVKQLRVQRNAALKTLRRTKQLKEEQAAKLTELSVGFESMVLEFGKCNLSIQQLEAKSLWKANELRAALAREGQLSADLEVANSRLAALEAQDGVWSRAVEGNAANTATQAVADRDEARGKLAVAVARIAELQSMLDAKAEGTVDNEASSSMAHATVIAQQTSMFSAQISSMMDQLKKAQEEVSHMRGEPAVSHQQQQWRAQEEASAAAPARGVIQHTTADARAAVLAAELQSTQLELQNAKDQAQAINEELSWVRHHINAVNYRGGPPESR